MKTHNQKDTWNEKMRGRQKDKEKERKRVLETKRQK